MNADALVLSTVNAPYKRRIDGPTLARCIATGNVDGWVVHAATLFVDVRPGLVLRFADQHGIDLATLARTYRSVRDRTGERSPALESLLGELAETAGTDVCGPAPAG
jgi:hypothetical protein